MATFSISENLLIRSLMGYLRRKNYYDTLCMLSLETNIIELSDTNDEILYINTLCLSGRWEDLLKYLQPLEKYLNEYQRIEYFIRKQQYFEALTWQTIIEPFPGIVPWRPLRHPSECTTKEQEEIMKIDMEKIVATLKTLEPLCSQREFNQLCNCLTYASLTEIPEFSSWTVSKGRFEVFERLYSILYPLFIEKKLVKPAEGSNEVHEIVYPTKGLEDVIAMGLQGFLENYSTANVPSLRGKAYQKMDRSIAVNLHSSGLLLPSGCELSPSHHHKLPVLMTTSESTNDSTRIDEEDEVPHPEVHFVDEKAVEETRIPPKDSKSNYEPEPVIAPKSQDTVSYESQEEKKIQPKGQNSKKPKGTSWNIEFDTPEEKPSVRVGNDLLRNRNFLSEKQDEKYDPVMSPYYSNAKSNSFEHLDHDLPQPPTQVDGKNKQPPPQTQLYDDHSVGSISTMDQTVKRGAVIEPKKKPEEKRNIPRWGQLPHGQATIIRPICVHRDSTPLRCVAMLTPPHADILEDSLGISHSNNEKPYSLLAVGSNSKSISILHYDHSARDSSGKVTIIDELSGVHNGSVYAVDWSNDGRSLASGSNDKYVRIISGHGSTGPFTVRSALKGHTGTVRTVKFSPHPAILASGGAGDCKMRVWDVNQGALLKEFTPHEDHIHVVEWISDTVVLSGCEKGQILVHDLRTAQSIWSVSLSNEKGDGGICSLYRNPGTDLAIIGHSNGTFSLFDLRTRRVLQSQSYHQSDIRSVLMWSEFNSSIHRNEIFALTTSFDCTSIVWQLHPTPGRNTPFELIQQAKLIGHQDKILSCTYSRLTNDIFTSSADGTVLCWNPLNHATTSSKERSEDRDDIGIGYENYGLQPVGDIESIYSGSSGGGYQTNRRDPSADRKSKGRNIPPVSATNPPTSSHLPGKRK